MYFHEEPPYEQNCCSCEDKESALKTMKYWFKSIVDQIYSKHSLDSCDLENCLDELSRYFHMRLPETEMQISRKQETKVIPIREGDEVESWKNFNNEYLRSLSFAERI